MPSAIRVITSFSELTGQATAQQIVLSGLAGNLLALDADGHPADSGTSPAGFEPAGAVNQHVAQAQHITSQYVDQACAGAVAAHEQAHDHAPLEALEFLSGTLKLVAQHGLQMGGTAISDLATPVNDTDAATKGYVDGLPRPQALGDLSDVLVDGPDLGHCLTHDGARWVNRSPSVSQSTVDVTGYLYTEGGLVTCPGLTYDSSLQKLSTYQLHVIYKAVLGSGASDAVTINGSLDVSGGVDAGGVNCTKLTAGTIDPEILLLDPITRQRAAELATTAIPEAKRSGATLFYNASAGRLEIYVATAGKYYDLLGNELT